MNPRPMFVPSPTSPRTPRGGLAPAAALMLAALSAAPAIAQQTFTTGVGRGYYLAPEGVSLTGTFSRGAVADFHADGLPDFVWVKGTGAQLMISPGLFQAPVDNALGLVNDVDVWPQPTGTMLATVGPDGLHRTDWNAPAYSWRRRLAAAGPWLGALRVTAARDGRTNEGVIYGVRADGVSLQRHQSGSTAGSGLLAVAGQPINDLTVADWDGDGDDDVVVAGSNWLGFFPGDSSAFSSQLVPTHVVPNTVRTIGISVGSSSVGGDFVAWCTEDSWGVGQLWIVRRSGQITGPIELEGQNFGGVAVGKVYSEQHDDIVITALGTRDLFALKNFDQGAGPVFGLQGEDWYRKTTTPSPTGGVFGSAQPLIADIDGDGDVDIGAPSGETGTMLFVKNGIVDERARTPGVRSLGVSYEGSTHDALLDSVQQIEFQIAHAPMVPLGANAIEARWWYMSGANGDLDPHSIQARHWPLDSMNPPTASTSTLLRMELGPYLTSPSPPPMPYFNGLFFCVLRYVQVNPSGAIVAVYPGQPVGFEAEYSNPNGPHERWLADHFLAAPTSPWNFRIVAELPPSPNGPEGGDPSERPDEIGTGGPGECVPVKQNCPPDTTWFEDGG